MSDQKISNLTELAAAPSTGDELVIVDKSDTSMAASGTTKKITKENLVATETAAISALETRATNLEVVVNNASASAPASLDLHEDTDNGTNKITITAPSAVASDKVLTLPDATGTIITFETSQLPEGYMLNGKILVTVSSNNITLALKGSDGNDPSTTNVVYCKIGGTIRTVTTALSVTKNAGTNWCNAGSSELATKEIDYFAYLGYNATDGVVIGFSRIPYACQYSDFSTTTTNEKYCAISTITNAAATDYYNVIGRFAATLSAGAGYTWSVPTFTAINLIQRPIYETRTLSFNPVATASSGTFTTVTTDGSYTIKGRINIVKHFLSVTNVGSASTAVILSLPFAVASGKDAVFNGREYSITGSTLAGMVEGSVVTYNTYNNGFPAANGHTNLTNGIYRIA